MKLAAIGKALMTPFRVLGNALRTLMTAEGRRAWALVLLAGGGIAMTVYALRVLWIVRNQPAYAFWLGVGSHITIIIVLTAFAGLLVKRRASVRLGENRELTIDDLEVVE